MRSGFAVMAEALNLARESAKLLSTAPKLVPVAVEKWFIHEHIPCFTIDSTRPGLRCQSVESHNTSGKLERSVSHRLIHEYQ
jgi:hypothetical protein